MISTIRTCGKFYVFALALIAFSNVAPVFADPFVWISNTGVDSNPCTGALPCLTFTRALAVLPSRGQINCLGSPGIEEGEIVTSASVTIDCVGVHTAFAGGGLFPHLELNGGSGQVVVIRNLTFNGIESAAIAISVSGRGTLIRENCVIEGMFSVSLDIEPSGPFNLIMRNTRISNGNTVAVVLKPAAGGSINATFDHVTVSKNGGGGIRLDTTNGQVTADVTDSVISDNTGNGLSAQGGAGGAAMLSIEHSVIANNGAAGVNATGANGAALVDTTLLDSNANATSIASGGRIVTYGNNRIVGTPGAGFTGSVALQ